MQALRRATASIYRPSHAAPYLLTILAAALVYLNSLPNGFVYDDHFVVAQNPAVRELSPLKIFGSEYWSGFAQENAGTYYRPLTILSFAVDYAVWAHEPFGYHLTNLLLHTVGSLLVYLLGFRLIRNRKAALFAALLFAVHPVHTEAVSGITGRSDLLFGVLGIAALLLYTRSGSPMQFGAPVAFFLALCAKETALALPVVFAFCDLIWKPAAVSTRQHIQERWRSQYIWLLLCLAVFLVLRTNAVGNLRLVAPSPMDNPLVEYGLLPRLYTMPILLLHDLRLLVFPLTLSVDYSFNQIPVATTPVHPGFLAGALLLLLLALLAVRCWKRSRVALFGIGLTGAPLILSLNPFVPAGTILAERYLYLPSAGFCLLVALAAVRLRPVWVARSCQKWICVALACLILGFGALRTVQRNRDWHDDRTLFQSAVSACPSSVRARLNLAFLLRNQGDHASAAHHYRRVLGIRGDYPVVHYNLADTYRRLGQSERAAYHYEQAVKLRGDFLEAWTGLGNLYMAQDRNTDAERAYKTALNLAPDRAVLYNQLGVIYQERGDLSAARAAYEKAISGNYQHPGVFCNLGVVYAHEGRVGDAEKAYRLALELQPDLAIAHYHLANLYRDRGNPGSALAHYRAFLRYWTDDPWYVQQVNQYILRLDPSA